MSTNKTETYQLHIWSPGDIFSREEINANFSALDSAAAQVVVGSCVGDGSLERFIDLGFTPRAVLITAENGATFYSQSQYGGLAVTGMNAVYQSRQTIVLKEGGFQIMYFANGSSMCSVNSNGQKRMYLAVR